MANFSKLVPIIIPCLCTIWSGSLHFPCSIPLQPVHVWEQEGRDVGDMAAEFATDRSSCCPKEIWACRLKQTNGAMSQAAVTQCKSCSVNWNKSAPAVSASRIKFSVKTLPMLQSYKDVLLLSLPISGSSSKSLKYSAFGSGEEKENIFTSHEAVNKQWGILWKSINYALPHNLGIETCSFFEATKEIKLLNTLESL